MLTPRFVDALAHAFELHQEQFRKQTEIPYISHLMSVSALVLEDGGDEDEAIAALLHDAIEDQGVAREEIAARFGDRVAEMVAGCTDAWTRPKPPWRERKEAYLRRLGDADASVVRVSLADKLHNARAILLDYRRDGDGLWKRFSAGPGEQLWYYHSLLEIYRRRSDSPLVAELARAIDELERLVHRPQQA